jgi:protein-S-isoprenylcysteine O-methyltransferase Ste14
MTPLRMRFIKTVQLLILVNSAFTLGSYSETFSGSKWAWIAVGCCIFIIVLLLAVLMWEIWRTGDSQETGSTRR